MRENEGVVPAAPSFRVSTSGLQAAAARAGGHVDELESRVASVNLLVTSVIGSSWRGTGADAFASDFGEWLQGAHEVHTALARVASLLGSSAQAYAETEHAVTGAASSMHVVADPAPVIGVSAGARA